MEGKKKTLLVVENGYIHTKMVINVKCTKQFEKSFVTPGGIFEDNLFQNGSINFMQDKSYRRFNHHGHVCNLVQNRQKTSKWKCWTDIDPFCSNLLLLNDI